MTSAELGFARMKAGEPLKFGDPEQIAAYEHMERVAEIQRVIEGDDSDEHVMAVRDALMEIGWGEVRLPL